MKQRIDRQDSKYIEKLVSDRLEWNRCWVLLIKDQGLPSMTVDFITPGIAGNTDEMLLCATADLGCSFDYVGDGSDYIGATDLQHKVQLGEAVLAHYKSSRRYDALVGLVDDYPDLVAILILHKIDECRHYGGTSHYTNISGSCIHPTQHPLRYDVTTT